jgi:hypothetical protein
MKKHHHDKDIVRIANFMNGFLGFEMLVEIPCPNHLQCNYDDLDTDGKRQSYEYTLNEVFRITAMEVFCVFGRESNVVELGLIKRRIVNYFKESGIELENG